MPNLEFILSPDDVTFDPHGRVVVRNTDFVNALEGLANGGHLAATSNSGGCSDSGCGNTGNAGGCGTANGSCSSRADIYFDDWTIFGNDAIINNAKFAESMLDVKISGKPNVPMKLEID